MENLQRGHAGRLVMRLLLVLLILFVISHGQVVEAHSAQGFTEDIDTDDIK